MEQPDLGKRVVELRKAKGMTQKELAQQCNVSVWTLLHPTMRNLAGHYVRSIACIDES